MNNSIESLTAITKTKYKIVLLGDQYVGKTALIDRFVNERFEMTYDATIGIDFLVRNIVWKGKTYRLQLWDTAGQQRFKSLIPSYLKDANCAIIVYDLSAEKSLQNAKKWYELYNENKDPSAISILVGNKLDLKHKTCTQQMIQKLSQQLKISHSEVSAKTGQNINNLFFKIIEQLSEKTTNFKIMDLLQEQQGNYETKDQINIINKPRTKVRLEVDRKNKSQIRGDSCC